MVIGILQPSFLPWLGYFEQIHRADIFVFYDDVQYEKGSWRNRNRIKTPTGPLWLTVPVLTKKQGFPLIREIRINNSVPWEKKLTKSIRQHYSKTPYFKDYGDALFDIINRPWEKLCNLNLELISWFCDRLGIRTKMVLSSELNIPGKRVERLIRIIKELGGDTMYNGAAGRSYLSIEEFEREGIRLQFQDYKHPIYSQLYGDFIPYLSVIDLLFNRGPDSLNILACTGE